MSYILGQADWFYGINKPPPEYQCPPGHTREDSPQGIRCIAPLPPPPTPTGVPADASPVEMPVVVEEDYYEEEEDPRTAQERIMVQNIILAGGGLAVLFAAAIILKKLIRR